MAFGELVTAVRSSAKPSHSKSFAGIAKALDITQIRHPKRTKQAVYVGVVTDSLVANIGGLSKALSTAQTNITKYNKKDLHGGTRVTFGNLVGLMQINDLWANYIADHSDKKGPNAGVPTLTEQAGKRGVSTAAITGQIDALENLGFIVRHTGLASGSKVASDRRKVTPALTDTGIEFLVDMFRPDYK